MTQDPAAAGRAAEGRSGGMVPVFCAPGVGRRFRVATPQPVRQRLSRLRLSRTEARKSWLRCARPGPGGRGQRIRSAYIRRDIAPSIDLARTPERPMGDHGIPITSSRSLTSTRRLASPRVMGARAYRSKRATWQRLPSTSAKHLTVGPACQILEPHITNSRRRRPSGARRPVPRCSGLGASAVGRAKATKVSPDFVPSLPPPPAAITTNWRPPAL